MDKIELFIPGRLCVFGEHSDWAATYRKEDMNIEKGYAIAVQIEEGIYASCTLSNKFIIKQNNHIFECNMNESELSKIIDNKDYYSYTASVALEMLRKYNIGGILIEITKQTLSEKKGLSSSAAICVLVVRTFNKLYNLNLSIEEEMNIAYISERNTGSMCGKLDQIVALDYSPVFLEFDKDDCKYKKIDIGNDLYIVFADLNGSKNTKQILYDLNKAYTNKQSKIIECLGGTNKEIIYKAVELLKEGNALEIGKLMIKAQKEFDTNVAPFSPEELKANKLHTLLNDKKVKELSLGGKGVGSQGDGSVQFIVENKQKSESLKQYLIDKYRMNSYMIKLNKNI